MAGTILSAGDRGSEIKFLLLLNLLSSVENQTISK